MMDNYNPNEENSYSQAAYQQPNPQPGPQPGPQPYQQQYQQQQYQQQPYQQQYQQQYQQPRRPAGNHPKFVLFLILSIVMLLCCNTPFGIAGVVLTLIGNDKYKKGESGDGMFKIAMIVLIIGVASVVLASIFIFASGFLTSIPGISEYVQDFM